MLSPLHVPRGVLIKTGIKACRNIRRPVVVYSSLTSSFSSISSTMLDESGDVREAITFPAQQPVMLDSKEHVIGYLSRILNARVYDAAIETELQLAKNLSTVRMPVAKKYSPC